MAYNDDVNRIQPYAANPAYWQYRGEPVLLLGGSIEDNLFQMDDLEEQLRLLDLCLGNYLRCTMSSRDEGNVWPWAEAGEGRYDLETWNDEYWRRLERFLQQTAEHGTIVQVEIWATYDLYKDVWPRNPFNPANNVNYGEADSGLAETVDYDAWESIQPFFCTVPQLEDLEVVRRYQEAFVDKVLSLTLEHGHVLYCMDNETNAAPQWSRYWAHYVRNAAADRGLTVETTEMWDRWDVTGGRGQVPNMPEGPHPFWQRDQHAETLGDPHLYTFLDISQNNTQPGQAHYENIQIFRERVRQSGAVRPVNSVKIYGAPGGWAGTNKDGAERFWRNIFGGLAGVRFHRPPHGIGLSELAQVHIQSMRMVTEQVNVFACEPHNDLLGERLPNQAYCLAEPGVAYVVCLPDGGEVTLDCSGVDGHVDLQWLDVLTANWSHRETVPASGAVPLRAPGRGFHAVVVTPS